MPPIPPLSSSVTSPRIAGPSAGVPAPVEDTPPQPSAATIAEALRTVVRPAATDTLTAFLDTAARLTGCDGAGIIALDRDGRLEVLAATNPGLFSLTGREIDVGGGPGMEAALTTSTVVEADLSASRRWPRWRREAVQIGIGASLSTHLFTDIPLGGITFYSARPHEPTHQDLDSALTLAAHASVLVAQARSERDLWRAVETRTLIGQAQGILMHRYKLTARAAFDLLQRTSQNSNRKVRDIAVEIARTGTFDPQAATKPAWPSERHVSEGARRQPPGPSHQDKPAAMP